MPDEPDVPEPEPEPELEPEWFPMWGHGFEAEDPEPEPVEPESEEPGVVVDGELLCPVEPAAVVDATEPAGFDVVALGWVA